MNYLSAFFMSIWGGGVSDFIISIVDIILVFFFIYRFLVLIKGTRSFQILFGIIFLGFLFFVSGFLNMRATEELLGGFFKYFIIIVAIIFHEEIRNILSSFKLGSFFGSENIRGTESSFLIREISETMEFFAREKTGAIFVIVRNGDPVSFATGGVEMDSKVKKEILFSIFNKNSPLHDGAVIINEGRIQRASVVLPLSTNPNIDPNFGTRHRAACGISEMVDSLVFVVSEERGQISFFQSGHITRNLTKTMVRKILDRHME